MNNTRYEVATNDDGDLDIDEGFYDEDGFSTKKEALEHISDGAMGKHFIIYKTTVTRKVVKVINVKRPRPCYGGWGKGHHVYPEDIEKEKPFIFCKGCGYKLKLVTRDFNLTYILAKPLEHKEDKDD